MELVDSLASPPRIRILVGDNEEIIARTLSVILDLAGCAVCALYLGDSAARLVQLMEAQFDLIDLSSRGPAVPLACSSPLQISRCKVLLYTGQNRLFDILQGEAAVELPFELVICPVRSADLLVRLRTGLCSEQPPLLVPFDLSEAPVH